MNTIPTHFNEGQINYTMVGGQTRASSSGTALILLHRGGRHLRRTVLQELEKSGFDQVISVESAQDNFELEELSQRFPFIGFLQLPEQLSIGERINLAAGELACRHFFVLWNDLKIGGGFARSIERLADSEGLCFVPSLQSSRLENLPNLRIPVWYRGGLKTLPFTAVKDGQSSLYPEDWLGLYNLERFKRMGGFDPSFRAAYWQLLDFGFRAQLWGETIKATQLLRLSYQGEIPPEDTSREEDYKLFYLKNLAPVFHGDGAHIPFRRFPPYLCRFIHRPVTAWREFRMARQWVQINRYRFKADARAITELWETPES